MNTHLFFRRYRHLAYRQFVLWTYGVLGKNIRVPLPSCVVDCVRKRFPLEKNKNLKVFVGQMKRYSYVVFYLKWIYFFAELISGITSFRFFTLIKFPGWEILYFTRIIFREKRQNLRKPRI